MEVGCPFSDLGFGFVLARRLVAIGVLLGHFQTDADARHLTTSLEALYEQAGEPFHAHVG